MTILFFLAPAAAFAVAVGFYPALSFGPRARAAALVLFASAIAATPLLIPADAPSVRFVVAVTDCCLALKLIDLHLGALRNFRVEFLPFLGFLATRCSWYNGAPVASDSRPAVTASTR